MQPVTIKNIQEALQVNKQTAMNIYGLTKGVIHLAKFGYPEEYRHYRMSQEEAIMHLANKWSGGSGLEAISDDSGPVYEYINMGDSYAPTLMMNIRKGNFFISSVGDIVESSDVYS